jgi:uncharacterized membrane protein YqjE
MFHAFFQPFLRLVSSRPELLGDHAQAYAELFASELGSAGASFKRRALLTGLGICGLGVGAVLAGVALMLWAVMPANQAPALWALLVVPLPPFVLALGCLLAARRRNPEQPFGQLRRQAAADMAMLRQASSP